MVNSYVLVNPYIEGDFKKDIKAKNSMEASKAFYKNLSEHFNNSVPKFYFTIQKGKSGDGKYYNFEVVEKRDGDEVSFSIKPYKSSNIKDMSRFNEKLSDFKNKFAQAGGKKHKHGKHKKRDDSDSDSISSTDSEDFYRTARSYVPVVNQPFYYWWYDPYVYNLNSLWIPTFYSYVQPYIEISIPK
jgi:hypothetical protein